MYNFENMGLSFFTEGSGSVCMGMFQARIDIFQEFGPKKAILGEN